MDENIYYSEEDSNDKFYSNVESNEHLLTIYHYMILYFEQKFLKARISYTENYVSIKYKGGYNRFWFRKSGTKAFEFTFRKNINQKNLEKNTFSHTILCFRSQINYNPDAPAFSC